jgi:hypothetical protein
LQSTVLNCATFTEQVTKTNFDLWQTFFHEQVPANFVSLEQETIVNRLLLKYHLDQSTIINQFLFDPSFEALMYHYFDGIMAGFSTKEQWGTYLFWALPRDQKYRMQ